MEQCSQVAGHKCRLAGLMTLLDAFSFKERAGVEDSKIQNLSPVWRSGIALILVLVFWLFAFTACCLLRHLILNLLSRRCLFIVIVIVIVIKSTELALCGRFARLQYIFIYL